MPVLVQEGDNCGKRIGDNHLSLFWPSRHFKRKKSYFAKSASDSSGPSSLLVRFRTKLNIYHFFFTFVLRWKCYWLSLQLCFQARQELFSIKTSGLLPFSAAALLIHSLAVSSFPSCSSSSKLFFFSVSYLYHHSRLKKVKLCMIIQSLIVIFK